MASRMAMLVGWIVLLSMSVLALRHEDQTPARGEPDLAAVKKATERFRDVKVAGSNGSERGVGGSGSSDCFSD